MKNLPPFSRKVAFAYFNRRATPRQRRLIEAWLTTPHGTEQYYKYLDEWEQCHPRFQPDLAAARHRFDCHVRQADAAPFPAGVPSASGGSGRKVGWVTVAAVASVVVLAAWLTTDVWFYTVERSDFGETRSLRLPDGSAVLLGANSSLRYARFSFARSTPRVRLSGEAEFTLEAPPRGYRLRVETPDQTTVEGQGAVFSVSTRRRATRVVVEAGYLRLTTPRALRPLRLSAGDGVLLSPDGLQTFHLPAAQARLTWQDRRFVFAATPLGEVVRQMHDVFGVRVRIAQEALAGRTVSGTFEAETATDLLEALSMMMELEARRTGDGYVLSH